jgi:hypothetical protein
MYFGCIGTQATCLVDSWYQNIDPQETDSVYVYNDNTRYKIALVEGYHTTGIISCDMNIPESDVLDDLYVDYRYNVLVNWSIFP